MTKINSKKSSIKRKRNKLLRAGIKENKKTNLLKNIPILYDPSAVVFIGSKLLHHTITWNQANNRQKPSFILKEDAMLIPIKDVNEENLELLMSTLKRQRRRWNVTSIRGQSFFKIMM